MGAYYTMCDLCGEEISGRYGERDDPDANAEPVEVTERREEHRPSCIGRRIWNAAIKASSDACQDVRDTYASPDRRSVAEECEVKIIGLYK